MDNIEKPPQKHQPNNNQKPHSSKNEALIVGLVLAIVGSIVASSFEKGTLTNYAGFCMILVGITAFGAGVCTLIATSVGDRIRRENPELCAGKRRLPVCTSIWVIGVGVIIGVLGSILANSYDRALVLNTAGFGMLLTGITVAVLGLSSAALGTVKVELNRKQQTEVKTPRILLFDITSLGLGVVFLVIGTILSGSYAKETTLNYAGFGMLIFGVAILSLGASGTAVATLKARFYPDHETDEARPRIIFGSIWAIGIGSMLLVIGTILSGMFEKNSVMNYTGFGMLVSGAGVFVYGLFETARVSAMGYLNYRLSHKARQARKIEKQGRIAIFRAVLRNLVKTSAVFNLAGVIAAVCILFFSLWQLDLIVSGPVWWSSGEGGTGIGWSHQNGAYSTDYFQCFFWKTTIGQAYDTLFMLIFISFVVLFLSAYFWPKQDHNFTFKLQSEDVPPKKRKPRKKKLPAEAALQPAPTVPVPLVIAEEKPESAAQNQPPQNTST